MGMTKEDRERFDRVEKEMRIRSAKVDRALAAVDVQLKAHLAEVPTIIANQESERRDIWEKLNQLMERLFGNGTRRGSIEWRVEQSEDGINTIQSKMWTRDDQLKFEKELSKKLKLPWIILTQVFMILGTWAGVAIAFYTLFRHLESIVK